MRNPTRGVLLVGLLFAAAVSGRSYAAPSEAELRTRPIPITVETIRGVVQLCEHGCWPARIGQIFGEGTTIETGLNAFVRLSLPDGTHISLPSNSRMRVERMRRVVHTNRLDRSLILERGRAESDVTPMTDPGSKFVIVTPVAVSAVRGTLFRAEYDDATKQGSSGVLHGAVAVSGKDSASQPKAGEGVTATPVGVSQPKALLPPPVLLNSELPQTEPAAMLKLEPVKGAASYRVKLTSDPEHRDVLQELASVSPAITLNALPNGVYFTQATAVAADGLEGLPGSSSFLRLLTELQLSKPVQKPVAGGTSVTFSWRSKCDVPVRYRFVLRTAGPNAEVVLDQSNLKTGEVLAPNLKPGSYDWIVTATYSLSGRKVEDFSDPQRLVVP